LWAVASLEGGNGGEETGQGRGELGEGVGA
jgi:hypothetical protein